MVENPFFQLPPLSSGETPRVIQQSTGAGPAWQPQAEAEPREEEDPNAYDHPFKIVAELDGAVYKLKVFSGRVSVMQWSGLSPRYVEATVSFGGGKLIDDTFSAFATVGSQTLSAGTTYGVWVTLPQMKPTFSNRDGSSPPNLAFADGSIGDIYPIMPDDDASIYVTTAYTEPSTSGALTDYFSSIPDARFVFFLGKVVVGATSGVEVFQYRKSDIEVAMVIATSPFISVDTDSGSPPAANHLQIGDDGGLYVPEPPFISADTPNTLTDITSDGGWLAT